MSAPTDPRNDPQQPSTSRGPEGTEVLHIREATRKFNIAVEQINQTTLLRVCTLKRVSGAMDPYRVELARLQSLVFPVLLKPHKAYLSDLAALYGLTFQSLCNDLRFLVKFKKLPFSMKNSESGAPLFKMVANCVIYKNNKWVVNISRRTMVDKVTTDAVKKILHKNESLPEMAAKEKETPEVVNPPRRQNPKRGLPSIPADRIIDVKKKRRPPPEYWQPAQHSNFQIADDEIMSPKHAFRDVILLDSAFLAKSNALKVRMARNNMATRTKERCLSDMEYYSDDDVLLSMFVSFRIEHIAQIGDFVLPKVEDDGYFPPERPDKEAYLFERYSECNDACHHQLDQIRPRKDKIEGFRKGGPLAQELLHFHKTGLHIHGFFDVWEEESRRWLGKGGRWFARRWLVDIYNEFKFPLYLDLEDWDEKMRLTFDKVCFYNLRLMTVLKTDVEKLKAAGPALFSPYPAHLEKLISNSESIQTRAKYLNQIQSENNRVIEGKPTETKLIGNGVEEEVKRKPRRSRKSDPQGDSTNTKPLKSKGRGTSASSVNRAQLQKENVDKMDLSTQAIYGGGVNTPQATPAKRKSLENPSPRRNNPASATKRRHDDQPAPVLPPPIKKAMVVVDSWDEHTHRAMEEEHVDEEEEEEEEAEIPPVPMHHAEIWKPREEEGVSPEEYASRILKHYGHKKGDDSDACHHLINNIPHPPPPPQYSSVLPPGPLADLVAAIPNEQFRPPPPPDQLSTAKQRRPRNKFSNVPEDLLSPTSSTVSFSDELVTTPSVNGANGKPNRTYSMKQTTPQNKTVYPVKKLSPSIHSPVLNGVASPAILSPSSTTALAIRNAQAQMARRTGLTSTEHHVTMHPHQPGSIGFSKEVMAMAPGGLPNRATHFPPGLRMKSGYLGQNGYDAMPPSSSATRPPLAHRMPTQQPRIIQPPPHRTQFDVNTPASRAINHHQQRHTEGDADAGKCRRAMSFNDQMAYKDRRWESTRKKAASVPPNVNHLPPQTVKRSMSNTPATVPPVPPMSSHRPRSDSNSSMARSRQMLAIQPEPSVGDPNSRQSVPWIGNSSRARSTSTTVTRVSESVATETSGPLLPSSSTNVPKTTTMAYTVMDSSLMSPPSTSTTSSTRTYTNYSRKSHTWTPEELGEAVRSGSQRFQDNRNGDDGPTIKNYLQNLKS